MPIRPDYVKRIATEIIEQYPDAVGHDFEQNKRVVDELTSIRSKTVRNRVAGYITRQERPTEPDQSTDTTSEQ